MEAKPTTPPAAKPIDENSLIKQRREKLDALRSKGIDPFAKKFFELDPSGTVKEPQKCDVVRNALLKWKENPGDSTALAEGTVVYIAGRVTAHRDMGKSMFIDVRDQSGRIQVYAQKNVLGDELYHIFTHLDLGDFVGVKGTLFITKMGEPSVKLEAFVILAKALRPPPAKWHGLEDTEIRYRQRYLDLIANPDVKKVFLQRSAIVHEIRAFFHSRGYVEVETPAMQAIPGGAAAQPFKTFHNALGCEFYLRIALELYHKRLLVGGIDKLFEIGKNFRNEGLSRRHNPEFTMLEAYQAFGDYDTMMEIVESLIKHVAQKVLGTLVIEFKDAEGKVTRTIDLTTWRRVKYNDLVKEKTGADWFTIPAAERRQRAHDMGAELGKEFEDFEVTNAVFSKFVEPTLINPTFVTHLPKELVPLAKLTPDDPTTVEVFECCINGQEISPGYTEQNDPIAQRTTLEHQAGGEQQKLDEDFLIALEHGMPPAGGIGIGIDRLCMMLLGQESIRDVILFPQLKPK
ncbi:MAG TPA: lysine--tRNA ligase [Candidatus Sulfotelmatobacter sp.]|jgi:lysyl-tRNA synthetase class 2|nr:lysine--tRNA ligase [Candidatus Sulfotelmatobacter sp.]